MDENELIPAHQVVEHNKPEDCWIVVEDEIWNVTDFAPEHPGGAASKLLQLPIFHPWAEIDFKQLYSRWKYAQATTSLKKQNSRSPNEKPPLHTVINSHDFEEAAARSAPPKAFAFYSTAATDCWTRDSNESMIKRIWFRPRVLRDVSSSASHPLEDIVREAPGHPFLFQLYLNKQREKSRDAIVKAESLGIKAVFVTVDAAGRGKRESDERLKFDEAVVNPVTGESAKQDKMGAGLTRLMGRYIDQGMTWKDLAWIRSVTSLPIILKGIGCAEDAKLAMKHNVDGILLSNHGGRNLDFSPPSILLLLEMHKNCPEIFERMEVYIDGGFRRGGDILKALCLGAKAVGIGRSFLYALQYGSEGVEHLVGLLREEMESAMKLIGIKNLAEAHPGLVNTADVDHLVPAGLCDDIKNLLCITSMRAVKVDIIVLI
ncbi:hypothetical protein K4K49_003320 [Colletotrichum sp. SAR 10_70]|nr:hypothetical protein K4K50_011132 [Colletotrichum sp. SAR 10_71]KAI8172831.1 hypothetical protein K4K49_003320 [Colletotrichum sp. SAR 10_70]KAJ5005821.1 hypothetical protein K4K48_005905 [Colletotrichum sp. SAR 10_66]